MSQIPKPPSSQRTVNATAAHNVQLALEIPELPAVPKGPEDLNEFDLIVINTSGGKDSQAMLSHVKDMANVQNIPPDRLVAVHADLGRAEWKGTAQIAQRQAEMAGVRFEKISRPQGDLLDHVRRRGMWPSPKARYCTSDHKRSQVAKVVTRLDRERRKGPTFHVLNCMGIRAEESPARGKKPPYSPNRYLSTKTRIAWDWLPIHEWTEQMVWDEIERSGMPHHPAYDLGMPRLSCVLCIYAPKEALTLAGRHNPELLAEYAEIESEIGHSFKANLSISEIAREIEAGTATEKVKSWTM